MSCKKHDAGIGRYPYLCLINTEVTPAFNTSNTNTIELRNRLRMGDARLCALLLST
jgi:hypothetical protein